MGFFAKLKKERELISQGEERITHELDIKTIMLKHMMMWKHFKDSIPKLKRVEIRKKTKEICFN